MVCEMKDKKKTYFFSFQNLIIRISFIVIVTTHDTILNIFQTCDTSVINKKKRRWYVRSKENLIM